MYPTTTGRSTPLCTSVIVVLQVVENRTVINVSALQETREMWQPSTTTNSGTSCSITPCLFKHHRLQLSCWCVITVCVCRISCKLHCSCSCRPVAESGCLSFPLADDKCIYNRFLCLAWHPSQANLVSFKFPSWTVVLLITVTKEQCGCMHLWIY